MYNGPVEERMPVEELLNAAKRNEFQAFSKYLISEEDADVNAKDREGWTLLHYAVINENIDMVKTLLKNGADPTQVTSEGDIPLHVAGRKGSREIVDVFLKHASVCGINYVDTNTALHGDTPLHIAAKNGFTDIVKSLLSHGAIYNIRNKGNQTPIQLSKAFTVTKVLSLIEDSFEKAEKGDIDIINILKNANLEFTAIMKARNCKNRPLIHEAMANHHHELTAKLLNMSVDINTHFNDVDKPSITIDPLPVSSTSSIDPKEKLERLKSAAKTHLEFSALYLPVLRNMSEPYGSDKNPCPWKTVKEGSYLLGNTQALIESYKECIPGKLEDEDIKLVNDTLVHLQFDYSHISCEDTSDAYGGQASNRFASKGQGTVYYNMLHSDLNQDVRLFIDIVEKKLDTPVRRFLETVNQKLKIYS